MKRITSLVFAVIFLLGAAYAGTGMGYGAKASQKRYYREQVDNIPLNINAKGAVLLEQESGKVLYGKSAEGKLYPASTTKILTALLAIENGDINETVTLGDEVNAIDKSGSKAGLRMGERIKLWELLVGLMLPSGNDSANAIAAHIGRRLAGDQSLSSEKAIKVFVARMNERAVELGARNSNFVNPHGFHNENHYSTAYDLGLIAREAMKYESFRDIVRRVKYSGEYADGRDVIEVWGNTNKLINKNDRYYYEYATGIKTGHTTPAGYCLVSSASRNGMDVIVVVLNTTPEGQWKDSTNLLEYGLGNFIHYTLVKDGEQLRTIEVKNKLPWDKKEFVILSGGESIGVFNKNEIASIIGELQWDKKLVEYSSENENVIRIKSSIKKGQTVGKIVYRLNGEIVGEADIRAGRDLKKNFIIFDIVSTKLLKDKKSTAVTAATVFILMSMLIGIKKRKVRKQRKRRNLIR